MAVSSVGTPSPQRVTTGFTSAAGAWGTGQTRTAGNLLLAVITGGNNGTANTWSVSENSSTWTQQLSIGNNASGTSQCGLAIFTKAAAGSDSAPSFNTSIAGTGACVVTLFEFSGASTATPVDTSGIQQTGSTSATVNFSVTTSGNVAASGEYGISAFSQVRNSALLTWTETGSGWTSLYEDAVTSVSHTQINTQSGPTSGSALSDAGHFSTNTSGWGAGAVVVIQPGGAAQLITVSPATLSIPQGTSKTFGVSLASNPGANVTVTTARTAGNTGLSVTGGSSLTFTTANYSTPQNVTVTADLTSNGPATFTSSATGWTSAACVATETNARRPLRSVINAMFP